MALDLEVGLLSGKTTTVRASLEETAGALKRRAEHALGVLGVGKGRLLDSSGCVVDVCAPIKKARLQNGDRLTLLHINRVQIQACYDGAFAAILSTGSVVTWGDAPVGGDSRSVQDQLNNVKRIQASDSAFAALVDGGTIVTWGDAECGGNSRACSGSAEECATDPSFCQVLLLPFGTMDPS